MKHAINNSYRIRNWATGQRGFTLVEIMLAITLSLILVAGVVQIYLSSQTSFKMQNELARLQENQRISIDFLQRDIRQAGFLGNNQSFPPGVDIISVAEGVGNQSDSITIAYASTPGGPPLTDCLGSTVTGSAFAVNTYTVNDVTQQLLCEGNGSPGGPQPVADGITNMQILLGVHSANASNESPYGKQNPYADRYINSSAVTNLNSVVSARIAFLVQSTNPIRAQNTAQTFTLLDQLVTVNGPVNSRKKFQVVTTTIPIRNNPVAR